MKFLYNLIVLSKEQLKKLELFSSPCKNSTSVTISLWSDNIFFNRIFEISQISKFWVLEAVIIFPVSLKHKEKIQPPSLFIVFIGKFWGLLNNTWSKDIFLSKNELNKFRDCGYVKWMWDLNWFWKRDKLWKYNDSFFLFVSFGFGGFDGDDIVIFLKMELI